MLKLLCFYILNLPLILSQTTRIKSITVRPPNQYQKWTLQYHKSAANDGVRIVTSTVPITTIAPTDDIESRAEKNLVRTLAIIESKSSIGRIVVLFCAHDCTLHRQQIPMWIREFNMINNFTQSDIINYHYHRKRQPLGYYNVDALLSQKPVVLIYFIANKYYLYEDNPNNRQAFLNFLSVHENNVVQKPKEYHEVDTIIGLAADCNNNQKYVLMVHDIEKCKEPQWGNLVKSFYDADDITFIELVRPLDIDQKILLQSRFPLLRNNCQSTVIFHREKYQEITDKNLISMVDFVTFFSNENCAQIHNYKIQPQLTDVQLEYLKEEVTIHNIEWNATYIAVGAIGGVAVIALAISIFWGLNGTSFVASK